jgi:hypothetical protein
MRRVATVQSFDANRCDGPHVDARLRREYWIVHQPQRGGNMLQVGRTDGARCPHPVDHLVEPGRCFSPLVMIPQALPRERVIVFGPTTCLRWGIGRLRKLGETVTKTLESIPHQWKAPIARR